MEQEALGKSREFENTHTMPKNMRESMNEENEKLTHITAEAPGEAPGEAPAEKSESETTLPVEKTGSETTPVAPVPQASEESIVLRGFL